MKIRSGFVSNSSSSSFIVSGKESPKITIEIDLSSYVENKIETVKQLNEYFLDEYGYGYDTIEGFLEQEDWYKEKYNMCLKELEKQNIVFCGQVCNEGEAEESFIKENGLQGKNNFKIIQDVD